MIKKIATIFAALLFCHQPFAITLEEISSQLQQHQVTEGQFTQKRALRDLPNPLIITGDFTLAMGKGLLWQIKKPIEQTIRVNSQGLWQAQNNTWIQTQGASYKERQQMALFLNLFSGDFSGLASNFSISSEGNSDKWQVILQPSSLLMKQIFKQIIIQGNQSIQQIDLYEKQGDTISIIFSNNQFAKELKPEAKAALSQ